MRILIIEDNKQVVSALARGLKSAYAIDAAYSGQDGLLQALSTSYDAIILDLQLPDMNGAEVCKTLRQEGRGMPIMIITASIEVAAKVKLLDIGADDYVTKPCSMEEVSARLRALLRRRVDSGISNQLSVGDLELDVTSRTVRRQGVSIVLRRKEFDLLDYLMRNQGRPVTRSMIIEHVWDMNENLWTNAVDVHIKYLRDKVDRPFSHKLIKTIHGVGYKIERHDVSK